MREKTMNSSDFHPLSDFLEIETPDGSPVETMNSWGFASILWFSVKENNSTARKIAEELFAIAQNHQLDSLLLQNDEASDRQALAILATALEEKIEQKFSS